MVLATSAAASTGACSDDTDAGAEGGAGEGGELDRAAGARAGDHGAGAPAVNAGAPDHGGFGGGTSSGGAADQRGGETSGGESAVLAAGGEGGIAGAAGGDARAGAAGGDALAGAGGAGGEAVEPCVDAAPLPPTAVAPATLTDTGLYRAESAALAARVEWFEPKYGLWADGAEKARYIYVPGCQPIDTHDMNHWEFPVGTRVWKEFRVGGKRVETRLLHHFAAGQDGWLYAAYQWDAARPDDPSAAKLVNGVANANGTEHDIPSRAQCANCHDKLSERVLGFSALQLSHDGPGLNLARLSQRGSLSVPAPRGFPVPGTAVQQAALGYLHANCGGCHNQGSNLPNADAPLVLRLLVDQPYAETGAVMTAIGVETISSLPEISLKPRIDPQAPESSSLLIRMLDRGSGLQMPPLATTSTKHPDTMEGVAVVTAWVDSLPKASAPVQ